MSNEETDNLCLVEGCGLKARPSGNLCNACQQRENYHLERKHGLEYFTLYAWRMKRFANWGEMTLHTKQQRRPRRVS